MKALCIAVAAFLSCGVPAAFCQPPATQQKQDITIEDIDRQIEMTKDQITKYKGLASMFDRQASSLQSHDYSGSRHAAVIRDEILSLEKDLQQHLQELEKTRTEMIAAQPKPQT